MEIDEALIRSTLEKEFDVRYYRSQFAGFGDIRDCIAHYISTGWSQGLDPAPWFSTKSYLRDNPDVEQSGLNPFFHYLIAGRAEQRSPTGATAADGLPDELKFEMKTIEARFDPDYYRTQLPAQPAVQDKDLLRHFVTKGWRLGFDPAPNFSTARYLKRYQDVAFADINPIFHYIVAGEGEGREVSPSTFVPILSKPMEKLAGNVLKIARPAKPAAEPAQQIQAAEPARQTQAAEPVRQTQNDPAVTLVVARRASEPQPEAQNRVVVQAVSDNIPDTVVEALTDRLFFDIDFYRATYGLSGTDTAVLADFLTNPQRIASPYFDPEFYRSQDETIGTAPFAEILHYRAVGKAKGMHPSAIFDGSKVTMSPEQILDVIKDSELFDSDWYLHKNSDVARANADPVLHYSRVGHTEQKRAPNLLFDTKYYSLKAPDSQEYQWNPLVHYIILGSKKNIKTSVLSDVDRTAKIYGSGPYRDRDALFIQMHIAPKDGLGPNAFFDPWHYVRLQPAAADFPGGPLSHYLETGWKEGHDPSASFGTTNYSEANPDVRNLKANPYLHFLQVGQLEGRNPKPTLKPVPPELERFGDPEYGATGPWLRYDEEFSLPRNFGLSIAVHLHLYYVEMTEEFCEYLSHIPTKFNLFISLPPGRGDAEKVHSAFAGALENCLSVTVASPPNRGRDVAPFLVEFGSAILAHDLVLHFHSKRSPHSAKHAGWRRYLLHHVLGNRSTVTQILAAFQSDPTLGVMQPPYHPEVRAQPKWGHNREAVNDLLMRLGMSYAGESCLDFPAGSFFWARTDALRPLLEGRLKLEDFDEEAGQIDGTLAHAIERLLGIIPVLRGYSVASRFIDVGYNLINYYGKSRRYPGFEQDRSQDIRHYQDTLRSRGSKRARIAVVTAIVGPFDALLLPEVIESEVDYYCVSDTVSDGYGVFRIVPCPYVDADPRRTARYVKTNLLRLFPGYDFIVWIDGNVLSRKSIVDIVTKVEASKSGIGVIPHPIRHSYSDEAAAVSANNLDDAEIVEKQIQEYGSVEGIDEAPLIETNFMVLDARQSEVREFQRLWWNQINTFSRRDQLSINYCMVKSGVTWLPILPEFQSTRDSKQFSLFRHGLNEWGPKPQIYSAWHDKNELDGRLSPLEDLFRWKKTAQQLELDVVVCVYNALDDVKDCLRSVEAALYGRGNVIIVDDASDEPTKLYLEGFKAKSNATLIRHEERHGYTVSANDGVRAAKSKYVLLLNSDTIVPVGALDKIVDALERNPLLGVVGPLSNAASSQSVPSVANSGTQTAINPIPPGMTIKDLDYFLESRWDGNLIRTPLVHGFCFCVKREVFETIGYFDEENFPRGYGEENDFCFRAVDAGFDLGVVPSAYIFHAKSKSYGDSERSQLMEEGMQALIRKHGKARIARSVATMNNQPGLEAARKAVATLFDRPAAQPAGKGRLFLLPALRSDGLPTGSAYVRVLYPYRHSSVQAHWDVSVLNDDILPALRPDDAVVVQRHAGLLTQDSLKEWLAGVSTSGARFIYEIDDDLLDGATLKAKGFTGDTEALASRVITMAQQADRVTTSSEALFNKFLQINPETRLVYNTLDEKLWDLAEPPAALTDKLDLPLRDDRIIIGYAGTPTHDEDLDIVRDTIRHLSNLFPGRIDFQMIGGVSASKKAFGKVIPLTINNDYPNFVRWLKGNVRWDIGIAPLADTAFNTNKSYLKYLEYSAMGMATVCSNSSEYRRVVDAGETGLLVENTTKAWLDALVELVRQPEMRKRLARNALANVQQNHTLAARSATVLEVLGTR